MLHRLYVTLSFILSSMLTFISFSCLQDLGGNDRLCTNILGEISERWKEYMFFVIRFKGELE